MPKDNRTGARTLLTLKPRVQTLGARLAPLPAPSRAVDYRIRGRELQRIRDEHFRAHPLCVRCLAMDPPRYSIATELDHTLALTNGGTDTPDNRQGLCAPCHVDKTAEDLK